MNEVITLTISYGVEQEIQRVQNTVKRIPWFREQGYPADFAKLPAGITENSSDEEIIEAVKREYADIDYAESAQKLQQEWATVSQGFEKMREEPSFHLAHAYEVVLTKYGSGGSYWADKNLVITRAETQWQGGVAGIVVHEIVHMTIQYLIDKYHVRHWRKERLVGLLMERYFPGLTKEQIMREDVSMVDPAFEKFFPDMEAIARSIGGEAASIFMNHLFSLTVKPIHNELEESYETAMKRLNDFFGISWIRNKPAVFLVEDRTTIDCLRNEKSEPWVVGWSDRNKVFLLAREKMGIESDKAHSVEEYDALLAHELCHLFFRVSTGGKSTPTWLNEGLCGYVSGQIMFKKKPETFSSFLEFFDGGGAEVYKESGFVVAALIDTFGKEKMLELLRKIKETGGSMTKNTFDDLFKSVYGFKPTYDAFNNLAGSK